MTTTKSFYDRFCVERFELPSEDEIDDLEGRLRTVLPASYRRFLRQWNGGFFDDAVIRPAEEDIPLDTVESLYGIGASHESGELGRRASTYIFDDNMPVVLLPIGRTVMGSLILMPVESGEDDYGWVILKTFDESFWLADDIDELFVLLSRCNVE